MGAKSRLFGPALLERIARGDAQAFEEVYGALSHSLVRLGYRMLGDLDLAHEVAHDTFLKLWQLCREGGYGQVNRDLRAYVFRMAVNRCYDHLRRRQRHPQVSLDELLPGGEGAESISLHEILEDTGSPSARQIAEEHGLEVLFRQGMEVLNPQEKAALTLREFEDCSYQEIAETLDCSMAQVKSLIFRGRQKMLRYLKSLLGDRESDEREADVDRPGNALRVR